MADDKQEVELRVGGSFPLAYVDVKANVTLGPFTVRKTDHDFGLFDLAFTPVVASYHISQTDHVAFSFTFWTPTGDYDPNRLATLSLNNWTFIPGIAYTKVFEAEHRAYWYLASTVLYRESGDSLSKWSSLRSGDSRYQAFQVRCRNWCNWELD
jgi:hypothetical protein